MVKTTIGAGRSWHFSHMIGRSSAEHNESKFGRTGGFCSPMDLAVTPDNMIFVLSRGYRNQKSGQEIFL